MPCRRAFAGKLAKAVRELALQVTSPYLLGQKFWLDKDPRKISRRLLRKAKEAAEAEESMKQKARELSRLLMFSIILQVLQI